MANYPYVGYQPGYYQPQAQNQMGQFQQGQMPQQHPMMAQMQQAQVNSIMANNQGNGIIWVPGYAAAVDYLVAANSAVALWDSNNPFVYLKQADSTGKPTLKIFELVERDPNQQQNKTPDIQLPDFNTFVTWDKLEDKLNEKIDDMLSERLKKTSKASVKKEED